MTVLTLLENIGPEVDDPEEETFLLFSQSIPSQNLGFVDSKATSIELTIGGRDLLIHQSPTILSSSRGLGTTGAVIWKITPLFASWISSSNNLLIKNEIISPNSSILELGCGISGLIALTLSPFVQSYTLTDQEYVMKLLNQNLLENKPDILSTSSKGRKSNPKSKRGISSAMSLDLKSNITATPLDWETDDVSSSLAVHNNSFDAVIACDCIYNDALIQPLVQTCVDSCSLRTPDSPPSICIIAQQLRSAEVFESWITEFHKFFHVWRIPDSHLSPELSSNSGFVVHLGTLREAVDSS